MTGELSVSSFDSDEVKFNQVKSYTVKLGLMERLSNQQLGNIEPFPVTNIRVHLINSEQIGNSNQLCDDRKVPYYQV